MNASGLLKGLSPSQTSRLMGLLDESLDLEPAAREPWLQRQESTDPQLAVLLRELLATQGALQKQHFLETLNPLTQALIGPETALIGRQFGPYRIVSLLGHGGMGSVWLAERSDGLFSRQVALKLIQSASTGRVMMERFSRERNILATLNHPNIARLFDAGFGDDGQPYLALEYIRGTPLKTYCDEHWLSVTARLELFRQVLSAVQYAHARLVIHRDLKPPNILVSDDGQVHLLDFGIAKLLGEGEAEETELTRLGGRAMTPDYASPEQVAGAPVTIATDVYSLGVMLYEIVTGERPYRPARDTRSSLEEAILNTEPVPPSRLTVTDTVAQKRSTTAAKLTKALSGDVETIVLKALKKSPAERYATAAALSEDIGRFLRGDVVLAQRDSLGYRARKYVQRHRLGITVATVLLLTLLGGLATTSYEARVAAKQRDAALDAQSRSLTQTAAARLKEGDFTSGEAIILEVIAHQRADHPYTPEALAVFQEARAADTAVLALTGHTDRVRSVTYSPDGTRILTSSDDKTARVWDAVTGRQVLELRGHADRLRFAVFSPDGRLIATSSLDKTARIWDAATLKELRRLSGHSELILSTEFSPDGQRVVTASNDNTAAVWDVATGRRLLELKGHLSAVEGALFSPDGKNILTSSFDKTIRVWDAATGAVVLELKGHAAGVNWATYSPDGKRIVSASFDKTARIWDAATGRQLIVLSGHSDSVATAVFSPDGRRVVTASSDKTTRIWDAMTGAELLQLAGHAGRINSAAFSADGRNIVTAATDRTARVWDATTGQQLMVARHTGAVFTAAYSPDGHHFLTAADDNLAHLWEPQVQPLQTQISWTQAAQFDPLVESERFQLGLAHSGRPWTVTPSKCDESAAAPYDPQRRSTGVPLEAIAVEVALETCVARAANPDPRILYQHGRAAMASGDYSRAREDFERALAGGYAAAGVDLGRLLRSPGESLDPSRAAQLYRAAWDQGVAIAGFSLGELYEKGVRGPEPSGRNRSAVEGIPRSARGATGDSRLVPDQEQAWIWYRKAAEAGEPNALARLAEKAEDAAADSSHNGGPQLLEAFRYYAAAAERAQAEDWPDASWRNWRYRRAYLARKLARAGKMQDVANIYKSVERQFRHET